MKTTTTLKTAVLTAATIIWSFSSQAGDITRCDKVFDEVRAAVAMEPQKILVIVEDSMVANETCACEIVKAAIMASKADRELIKQIVLTATHMAPKMAPLIAECAGAISAGGGKGVVETVKQEIGVQPDGVQPLGFEGSSGGADYALMPGDIRGVYLIQPATGGFSTSTPPTEKPGGSTTTPPSGGEKPGGSPPPPPGGGEKPGGSTKVVIKRILPKHSVPQSPSVAQGP